MKKYIRKAIPISHSKGPKAVERYAVVDLSRFNQL